LGQAQKEAGWKAAGNRPVYNFKFSHSSRWVFLQRNLLDAELKTKPEPGKSQVPKSKKKLETQAEQRSHAALLI